MRAGDLIDLTRSETLRDIQTPYLFSDESLLAYLNEGASAMARKTYVFTDEFVLTTVAGQRSYALPAGALTVLAVTQADGCGLTAFTRRVKPHFGAGRPYAYSKDSAGRMLVLHPTPDAAYDLLITYAHVPARMTEGSDIPLDDDRALLLGEWMAYRALRNNDPDGSATIEAEKFRVTWLEGLRDMKREIIRDIAGDNPSAQPRKWT